MFIQCYSGTDIDTIVSVKIKKLWRKELNVLLLSITKMVIAFKRNTLIVLVRQLSMVEIFSVVSLGESTILKQANLSKADFVLSKTLARFLPILLV